MNLRALQVSFASSVHSLRSEAAVPKFSFIKVESKASQGLLSSLSMLRPPLRDRCGLQRRREARRVMNLSPEEEDAGIWSLGSH